MKLIQDQIYQSLPNIMYDICAPRNFASPQLAVFNQDLYTEYGLPRVSDADFIDALFETKNTSLALAYAGHQFGHYSPILGDGRAHLIGQLETSKGQLFDVQLKGSGGTKFSRRGDGLATLASMLREYLISEALAGLGIPTSRTLAVLTTGEQVSRDYQFHAGAIQVRTATSHIRVGSFQYAFANQGKAGVSALADFFIQQHFPELMNQSNRYEGLLRIIATRQADIIARWMGVGFVHGVMNTDNMCLLESLDFGPCAFLDEFNPNTGFSAIDTEGRYAWGQQGQIGLWNLQRFAETLMPLLSDDHEVAAKIANEQLNYFINDFEQQLTHIFHMKFALIQDQTSAEFVQESLILLHQEKVDFSYFFDQLTQSALGEAHCDIASLFQNKDKGAKWLTQWQKISSSDANRLKDMRFNNPRIIARNHQVEQAIIDATEQHDFQHFNRLCQGLKNPYQLLDGDQDLQLPPTAEEKVSRTYCGT